MLTLNQFAPNPKCPDISTFCSKVEMFLKVNELPYQGLPASPIHAPKGKLPTLLDGKDLIADSELIIRHLCKKFKIDPEPGLTPEQKAISFMIRKTMEEHYYFIMLHTRWVDPKGWSVVNKLFFSAIPKPLKLVVPGIVRKQVTKAVTKAQRTATKRVSKAVATTATKTSNAARRVARKASSVAATA